MTLNMTGDIMDIAANIVSRHEHRYTPGLNVVSRDDQSKAYDILGYANCGKASSG